MSARIFQETKNAMQAGRSRSKRWILEFAPAQAYEADPLMGWTGSGDTQRQLQLVFASQENAIDYAQRNDIAVEIMPTPPQRLKIQLYADNFR